MAGNVESLLTPPTQAMGGYGAASYAGQLDVQSMTMGELAWYDTVWNIVKTAAPILIGILEEPMPAAGGIGQQSSGQLVQSMANGQVSTGQMTITQLWSIGGFFRKALPIVIDVGKQIIQNLEAKQGVGAAGITVQEFDAAAQALASGKFDVENMQVNELGIFDLFMPPFLKAILPFSTISQEPAGVGQQDFSSVLQKINQVAGVVPSITDAVSQIVKLINGFRSQGIQGQGIGEQAFGGPFRPGMYPGMHPGMRPGMGPGHWMRPGMGPGHWMPPPPPPVMLPPWMRPRHPIYR